MHFREPGSSLYFIFINSYIFFLYFFIHIFFFIFFFSLYSFFLFLISSFFYLLPLNSKLHHTYLLPMLRRLLVLGQRGDRDKVGTRNIFPLERYLKS
jgi:hypothetical protein